MITPAPIEPARVVIMVRGQRLQLESMSDAKRIDWIELQVLAAQETIRAMDLVKTGKTDLLREAISLLVSAEIHLCRAATGWDIPQLLDLTKEERQAIVAHQDQLNRVTDYQSLMAPYAYHTATETQPVTQ